MQPSLGAHERTQIVHVYLACKQGSWNAFQLGCSVVQMLAGAKLAPYPKVGKPHGHFRFELESTPWLDSNVRHRTRDLELLMRGLG